MKYKLAAWDWDLHEDACNAVHNHNSIFSVRRRRRWGCTQKTWDGSWLYYGQEKVWNSFGLTKYDREEPVYKIINRTYDPERLKPSSIQKYTTHATIRFSTEVDPVIYSYNELYLKRRPRKMVGQVFANRMLNRIGYALND